MKIILKNQYKSLYPFESEELNNFTVITGKNGSGKSQLLSLIDLKNRNDLSVVNIDVDLVPAVKKIQSEGIIINSTGKIGHEDWKKIIQQQLKTYRELTPISKEFIKYIFDNKLEKKASIHTAQGLISNTPEYRILLAKVESERSKNPHSPESVNQVSQMLNLRRLFNYKIVILYKFINELREVTGKSESELTDTDFYNSPIQENLIDENDLFSSKVELIFYNYSKRRDINRKNYFYKIEEGETNDSVSDVDFISKFIPPWEIINSILTRHNIDFYFPGIEKKDFTTEVPLDFTLLKKSTNEIIPFNDLSSGEKIIIGLILKLFTSEYYGEELSFPELLILDEPDAHLHPEMSKLLLDVLEDTFVKKYGINVIISTHSPSTIALASETSIYQLSNGKNTELKKITKDNALQILTSFIPTLSINYKNHRQVFVESPTDVNYYQQLHDKHSQYSSHSHKLYFISNSPGKSNCAQVYKIVREIRKSGNTSSFGIVDWDLTNKAENYIYVHGINERYSVENFVLDPIYIICLLIDNNNAHNILEKIGLSSSYNQYLLGNESDSRLEELTKLYFQEFESKFSTLRYDRKLIEVEYLNGRKIKIPEWYLLMKGHEIDDKIKVIFPALGGKYRNEGEIQNALTTIMAKCYPFVPVSSVKVIEEIANCS
ncbi:ATP-dependent nuclease [Flavobacterium sp. TBRC 19031]|uniref:ATP-dependent nuclease n=1 Tax=Flavobacterium mekongense TaxID=3379707 RepID=UPI00399BFB5C